jgi:hypothetical protein
MVGIKVNSKPCFLMSKGFSTIVLIFPGAGGPMFLPHSTYSLQPFRLGLIIVSSVMLILAMNLPSVSAQQDH